jgi:hypothetical protein
MLYAAVIPVQTKFEPKYLKRLFAEKAVVERDSFVRF